jgi:outer membrane biosynthesis protein TonB
MQRALAAAANARDDGLRAALAAAFAHLLIGDDERLDEALALADVAEAHARDITTQVGWRLARARVIVRRGRGALAERLVREAVSLAEQTDSTDLRATALLDAADVRRQAGRPAEAEPFEKRALRLFERRGATAQAARLTGFGTPQAPEPDPVSPAPVADDTPAPSVEHDPPAPIEPATQEPANEPPVQTASADDPEPAEEPALADEPEPADEPTPATDTFFANGSTEHSPDERGAEDESKHRWFNR